MSTGHIAVATLPGRKQILFLSVHDATGATRIFRNPSRCRGG
jgi:hypothetical protein